MVKWVCVLIVSSLVGFAQAQRSEPARVASQYKAINAIYRARRFERLADLSTPDAVIVAKNGSRTSLRAAIPKMNHGWSNVVKGWITETPVRVIVKGSKATAYVVQRGQTLEREGKRLVTMKAYGRVIDTWGLTPKGWRLKESRSVTGLMMVPVWVQGK